MKIRPKTLTARIILLSVFWIVVTLLATALLLTWQYREHIQEHYDAHVFTHMEELSAALEIGADGGVELYRRPTDPRFHRLQSGWYWQVMAGDEIAEKSPSLGAGTVDIEFLDFEENHDVQQLVGPHGQQLRAFVMHMSHERLAEPVTIITTVPNIQIQEDVTDFLWHILGSFLALAAGLLAVVFLQVRVALRPLGSIRDAITKVKTGRAERLPRDFPDDVQPVIDELNALIEHNNLLVKRARTQLGDLAHAVKTPLTVIRNEARSMASDQGQLILDQAHVMDHNIDHYLARARVSGQRSLLGQQTSIKPVVNDLKFAVERMYRDRSVNVEFCSSGDCRFFGEVQDLEEMLGNLIDNACKWAKHWVEVRCRLETDRLLLTVEDDGPGIPEAEYQTVMQRGAKLDYSTPGHGQGLGIVRDIADLYGGCLRLSKSELGGLKAELDLPAAL